MYSTLVFAPLHPANSSPPFHPSPKRSQSQRTNSTQTHHRPTSSNNALVLEIQRQIPNQMPNAIKRMERKGHRNNELQSSLHQQRQASKRRSHARRIQVPAEQGRDEICGTENVEPAGENAAGDTVQCGENPGDLGLVDCEVGRDGATFALLDEDLVGVGWGHL